MALYRENATGFLQEWASNPGAGYTALSAQPTDTLANRVNWWRAADIGGLSSVWHPSLQGGMEVPKPPGTAGSGVNIMAYRYSSWEEPDGLPSLTLTNVTAARNSGGYNGAYKLSLTATAGNGTAYLTPLSNVYNIKLTQNLRWIISLYVSPNTSGAKDFNVLVKSSGAGTVYSLPMTTGSTAGQWTRVYAALDLRADTSVSAMLGLQIVTNGVRIDVDAIMIEELVGDTVWPSAYYAPITTVDGSQIVNGSITGSEIASATITGDKIASATITGSNIANATITGSQIGSVTITASNIANLTITASQIANATITGAKIAGSTITDANIVGGTITGASIANATITGAKIADATITSAKISSLNADVITAGTLSVDRIAANSINGVKLGTGSNGVDTVNLNTAAATYVSSAIQSSFTMLNYNPDLGGNGTVVWAPSLPQNSNRGRIYFELAGNVIDNLANAPLLITVYKSTNGSSFTQKYQISFQIKGTGLIPITWVDEEFTTATGVWYQFKLSQNDIDASIQFRGTAFLLESKR